MKYPFTKKVDTVDEYFGVKIDDSYSWLEDLSLNDTNEWVDSQNKFSDSYLSEIPFREKLRTRIKDILNYPKKSVPIKKGDYYYYFKNDGLQNQSVLYRKKEVEEVVLDINSLNSEGTVSLSSLSFSRDGKYLAYGLSESGSTWSKVYVLNLETLEKLDDEISNIKFDDGAYYDKVVWFEDGFFYTRFPVLDESKRHQDITKDCKVYYHKLGALSDKLIYSSKDSKITYGLSGSKDSLYIYSNYGNGRNSVLVKDLKLDKWFEVVTDEYENENLIVNEDSNYFYMHTNKDAPMKRLVKISKSDLSKWSDVVLEKDSLLEDVLFVKDYGYVLVYLENASNKLRVVDCDFKNEFEITLPTFGSVHSLSYDESEKELYYGFTSFTYPSEIYKYSFEDKKSNLVEKSKVKFDFNDYESKQVWFDSYDGTKVPMFVVHKKGIKLDSNNMTLLYGYGGFNISLTPHFSIRNLIFLEQGGVYAMVNLRGGGEFGENWHRAGIKEKKQNVFDDFIYAAKYLISNGYTNSSRLGILGGSNGGLLVAACALQEPKLFKAVLCIVGVLDMLKFHKFTNGSDWIGDYGCSDNEFDFNYLIKYSPYHNVKSLEYPSMFISTGDFDDNVVPSHSYKFAARLQELGQGENPILLRVDRSTGHGGGKPMSKVIDEITDEFSFLFSELGWDYR